MDEGDEHWSGALHFESAFMVQKQFHLEVSQDMLDFESSDHCLNSVNTGNESWVYGYDYKVYSANVKSFQIFTTFSNILFQKCGLWFLPMIDIHILKLLDLH